MSAVKGQKRNPKTGRRNLVSQDRRAQAIELRAQGLSLQEIGDRLGVSRQAVFKMLEAVIVADKERQTEYLDALRERQMREALDLRAKLFEIIEADGEPMETVAAVKALVGVQAHEARLWGAFAPERRELTGANGGPLQTESKVAAVDLRKLDDSKLAQLEQLLIEAQPSEPPAE